MLYIFIMPRTRASYRPEKKKTVSPAPASASALAMPSLAPTTPSMLGSVVQGFGFGLGSSVAHRVVGSLAATVPLAPTGPAVPAGSATPAEPDLDNTVSSECEKYRRSFDACVMDSHCSKEEANKLWFMVKKECKGGEAPF